MAENNIAGATVSFSTDSADQVLRWMNTLIYEIDQRKVFLQQNANDATK